jgi:DNA repair protein RadC
MENKKERGGKRSNAGRPKKEARVKKQLFLNENIVEQLQEMTADEVNLLLISALRPNVNTLQNLETSHRIAEIEVNYKPNKLSNEVINGSKVAASILSDVWSNRLEWVEEFVLLLLNNQNQPLGYVKLFQGGLNQTIIDSRVVFGIALVAQASGFIISHNHPSGVLKPSQADISMTNNLVAQGRIMGINCLDHIIIGVGGYYSFKDEGLIY